MANQRATPGHKQWCHTKAFEAKAKHILLTLFPCSLCANNHHQQRHCSYHRLQLQQQLAKISTTMPAKFIATYKTFCTTISPLGGTSLLPSLTDSSCSWAGTFSSAAFITKYFNIFRKCFKPTFVFRTKYHLSSNSSNKAERKNSNFSRLFFGKGCYICNWWVGRTISIQVGGQFFCGVIKWHLKWSFRLLQVFLLTSLEPP